MRAVVAAYGEVGFACLDELLALGADVRLVLTHRDAPGEKIWFPSVAERARRAGVPALTPDDVNSPASVEALRAAEPDLLLSFFHRQMMKPEVLRAPRAGAFNLHGSLLPRYRGRAPVNWMLLNGETRGGVTLHGMDEKPDHGEVLGQRPVSIDRDDTARTLTVKLGAAGREVLREVFPALVAGTAVGRPQEHLRSSYYGGRKPADGRIDWSWSAERIRNLVRAVTDPWPGAFSPFENGTLVVWWAEVAPGRAGARPGELVVDAAGWPRVATGEGDLVLTEVAWEQGPTRSGLEWVREGGVRDGQRLGAGA